MFSSGWGSLKASCNGKCFFLREVQVSHKQTDGHTYMQAQTMVPSWFDVSHSESHFYLKSQISINTGLDCCEKIAAGLVPTHLCEPLRTLWIDYTSSLVHTLSGPPSCNKQPISFIRNATENPNLSSIHIQPTLLSQVQTPHLDSTFETAFIKLFIMQKGVIFSFLHPNRLSKFSPFF